MKRILIVSAALLALTGGALAANNSNSEGLVTVSLGDVVVQDIANNLNVDVSQIPVTLQVPVGVAANVCNVDATVLAKDKSGPSGASCAAQSTNQAFDNLIQKNLVTQ